MQKTIIYEQTEWRVWLFEFSDDAKLKIELFFLENQIELFKSEIPKFLPFIPLYRISKILWDLRHFQILIEPELQEWIDTYINAAEVQAGIVQEAFVMPPR
jgi:hypothetical protein